MYVKLEISTRKNNKYVMCFYASKHDKKPKKTHFGAKGYEDFTTHHDEKRKERYINRHKHEDWTDPKKAGTLSRYILWNKKTIKSSFDDYKNRFNLSSY